MVPDLPPASHRSSALWRGFFREPRVRVRVRFRVREEVEQKSWTWSGSRGDETMHVSLYHRGWHFLFSSIATWTLRTMTNQLVKTQEKQTTALATTHKSWPLPRGRGTHLSLALTPHSPRMTTRWLDYSPWRYIIDERSMPLIVSLIENTRGEAEAQSLRECNAAGKTGVGGCDDAYGQLWEATLTKTALELVPPNCCGYRFIISPVLQAIGCTPVGPPR